MRAAIVSFDEFVSWKGPAAFSIGNFDGVHRGHRRILRRLRVLAGAQGLPACVLVFDPHHQQVVRGNAPPLLTSARRRTELLLEAGAARVVTVPFTYEFSKITPVEFVDDVLSAKLRARVVVVGSNFRFGHKGQGSAALLRRLAHRNRCVFEEAPLARVAGRVVSSGAIRQALMQGDLAWANLALGGGYRLEGKIVAGKGRGRSLGFRTANLNPAPGLAVPKLGIYAGRAVVGNRRLPAAISVGTNPTFDENERSVEAHILGFDENLLGREIAFEFSAYLRDEVRFSSPTELSEAIAADVAATRTITGLR